MSLLLIVLFACGFGLFAYFMVTTRTRRQVVAVALVGVLAVTLVSPPRVQAATLWDAIQAVLNVINGTINTALQAINSVRTAISDFYQQVIWPVSLIDEAKAQVSQMIAQYRSLMASILGINLNSATLPVPSNLQTVMRDQQTGDFGALTSGYGATYGTIPTQTTASPADRNLTDMDDALALDNLKTLKETDAGDELTIKGANDFENEASQAAPGSAPYLTATAVVASIESQALMQKMLAAELREEAAQLAHQNALRKRSAAIAGQVNQQILNLLKRR
jgi:hypothetical protein